MQRQHLSIVRNARATPVDGAATIT
jgi:hypothetical protein